MSQGGMPQAHPAKKWPASWTTMRTKTKARIRKKTSTKPILDELPSDGAELVILSRKRIDNDGPKSASQSATSHMTQWVRKVHPRELHKHLLRGSQLDLATGV
jgi:hypothetical protein